MKQFQTLIISQLNTKTFKKSIMNLTSCFICQILKRKNPDSITRIGVLMP